MAGNKKNNDGSDIGSLLIEFIGMIVGAIFIKNKLNKLDDQPEKTRKYKSYESTKPKVDVNTLSPKAKYEYQKDKALYCLFGEFPLAYVLLMLFPIAGVVLNFDEKDNTFSLIVCIISGILIAILTVVFIVAELASIKDIFDAKKEYEANMSAEERKAKKEKDKVSVVIAFILLLLVIVCAACLLYSMVV